MVAAARYYEMQTSGLGAQFIDEVQCSLTALSVNPYTASKIKGDIRRRLLARFPFGILFVVEKNALMVLAVMHLKRQPGYWQDRLKK
jgi:toxin ParE1/3/4